MHCSLYHSPLSTCMDCQFALLGLYVNESSYVSSQRFSFYSILSWHVFLGESMSLLFNFCERVKQPFFRIFGYLPYSSRHPFFYVTCLHALMWIDQYSYFFSFLFDWFHFVTPFDFAIFAHSLFSHPARYWIWI